MRTTRIVSCVFCVLFTVALWAREPDWPQFRGAGGQATSSQTGLPSKWSHEQNIRWKTPLPGPGASSPISVGGRIFLTCYSGYGLSKDAPGQKRDLRLHVLCLDRDGGRVVWNKSIPARQPPRIDNQTDYTGFTALHGYASATPVSDGKAVFACFGETGVVAYGVDGRELWAASVGTKTHGFGSGASPILHGDLLIVNASIESGALVALNKATGKEVWRAPDIDDAWNTPVLVDAGGGKRELAVMSKDKLLAFDPATGQPLWSSAGSKPPRYICPSAVVAGDVVYAIHGEFGPAVAVRSGGRGDVAATHQLWSVKRGTNVSSPVYHDGHLYWCNEQGVAFCVDARQGKVVYEKRLEPAAGDVYASPIVADNRIYYVSRKKGAFVLAAQPKFELLAHNVIGGDDGVFNASPVVSDDMLLLRSDRFLYAIGSK